MLVNLNGNLLNLAYLIENNLENRIEEPTLAARDVFIICFTPIPLFHEILVKELRWKFTKTSLSYVEKSAESNRRNYTGHTKRFDDYFTSIPSFRDIIW